jgi:hypothetical protein
LSYSGVVVYLVREKWDSSLYILVLLIDGWRVVDDDYGQAVGKLQAESMMSTSTSLFPQ